MTKDSADVRTAQNRINPATPPMLTPAGDLSFSERVLAASQDAFFQWTTLGNHYEYSKNFSALLGYASGQLPLSASSISAHICNSDLPSLKLEMAKAAYHGENMVTQFRMHSSTGALRWFKLRLTVLEKNANGNGTLFIGCVSDIDEEVKSSLALAVRAKSEAWVGETVRNLIRSDDPAIFNQSFDKLCNFLNIDYVILRRAINHGEFFQLVHWGHNAKIVSPPDFKKAISRKDLPYNINNLNQGEIDFLTPAELTANSESSVRQIMHNLQIKSVATLPFIYQGKVDHYLSLMVCDKPREWQTDDIKIAQSIGATMSLVTSRKRITDELEANAMRLFNVLDATEDAIWDWDIARDSYYVSPTFLFMLGYDEEYLPLTRKKLLDFFVYRHALYTIFQNHPTDDQRPASIFSLPIMFKHRDGRTLTKLFRGKQIAWDASGNPSRCVGAASEIHSTQEQNGTSAFAPGNSGATPKAALNLHIKAATQTATAHNASSDVKHNTLTGKKILLVEDNLVNQKVAKGMLMRRGINVSIASNGQEAVALLSHSQPQYFDGILMDLDMPILDGCQATQVIRKMSDFQTIPIIAVTAHSRPEDRARCINAGMNDHIAKPLQANTLYYLLEKHLAPANTSVQ